MKRIVLLFFLTLPISGRAEAEDGWSFGDMWQSITDELSGLGTFITQFHFPPDEEDLAGIFSQLLPATKTDDIWILSKIRLRARMLSIMQSKLTTSKPGNSSVMLLT